MAPPQLDWRSGVVKAKKKHYLASFDHLHKCEVDKHLKNGILTHKAGPIADEG